MIYDFNSYQDDVPLQAEICIIGSGAAGLTLASEFFHTKREVLVLEAGGKQEEAESTQIYQADILGLPHEGVHQGRVRVFGGSTTAWGGMLLPLSEADFSPKDWVPLSGWPLSFHDLTGHYRRAETMMGVGGPPYDEQRWASFGKNPPELDPELFRYCFSQCATHTKRNLARLFERDIARSDNVNLLLHANVVDVLTNKDASRVEQIEIKSFAGRVASVKAKYFVICCGGIETARLLLASNQISPNGVGNRNDVVGRYFQDHVCLDAGEIIPNQRRHIQALFDPYFRSGVMYTPKIVMAEQEQRKHQILNVMGYTKFEVPEDSGFEEVKHMLAALQARRNPLPSVSACLRLIRDSKDFARLVYGRLLLNRRSSMSRGGIRLLVDAEQSPNPQSRVRLSDKADTLGMPRAVIDWHLNEIDVRTLHTFASLFQKEWQRLNLGRVELAPLVPAGMENWQGNMRDTNHHIGTTRMSDDPKTGVVDRNCKVYDISNLYIGSSSVFPTGGHSNPTLTIMALCIRMADHLKQSLAAPSGA